MVGDYETSKKMWERRPTWELRNMVKALGYFPWLNTNEDRQRLAIAKAIIHERSNIVECKGCNEKIEEELLSGIELCPNCTGAWVEEATSR